MKKLSKRSLTRIIVFITAAIAVVAVFCGVAVSKALKYERKNEAMYQQNLAAAGEYLNDIGDVIVKGIYSESAADQNSMCADVWMNAYEAKNAFSSLPIAELNMEKCYAFLSKIAEYARSCEKSIASGKKLDKQAHDTFLSIKKKTALLAAEVEKLQKIYLNTGENIAGGIDFSLAIPKTIATAASTSDSLKSLNKNLSDSPKLIYDGPFSDSINKAEPQMLKDAQKIDLKKATEIAENFLKDEKGVLKYTTTKEGNIPCYCFTKGNAYAEISLYGGKPVTLNVDTAPEKSAYDAAHCFDTAQAYLKALGYENMKCDYYELSNGIFIMNYHYIQKQINCYTDLIKVKVDTQSGKVCGFDAASYLTHHRQRSIRFTLSEGEAKKGVSRYLKIKSVKKALIPNAAEKEIACYEFRCLSPEGNELLVYIDAATGKQADLLILQIGENSVLTK
ncbi:MAG: germination protein YpeB [Clostridia bacterium]|nr:germination protein YpeB [Clostridia bacterium]